ncbi:MAG: hypothetical protein H0T42_11125 [Deltaproteobacteria bacterium]|nr:hypothetical protein [Deltaproteobacteria bacterium]
MQAVRPPLMDFGWSGERYVLTAPTPSYTGATALRLRVDGVASALHYVAVVTTAP